MKKIILFFALIISMGAVAQTKKSGTTTRKPVTNKTKKVTAKTTPVYDKTTFVFDIESFFKTKDGSPYAVVSAVGYTQSELYKKMLVGISKLYNNPDRVITKVEDEMLTINGIDLECAYAGGGLTKMSYQYNIQLFFKDGKIRINVPTITASKWGSLDWDSGAPVNRKSLNSSSHNAWINNLIDTFFKSSFGTTNEDW